MTAVVKPYDRFLLTVLGVAMYQHKDSEGPELALKGREILLYEANYS